MNQKQNSLKELFGAIKFKRETKTIMKEIKNELENPKEREFRK